MKKNSHDEQTFCLNKINKKNLKKFLNHIFRFFPETQNYPIKNLKKKIQFYFVKQIF